MSSETEKLYQPLRQEESSSSGSDTVDDEFPSHPRPRSIHSTHRLPIVGTYLFRFSIIVNIALFSALLFVLFQQRGDYAGPATLYSNPWINRAIKETSFYSPNLDKVDISPSPKEMEGSLFATDDPSSIYRMDPSPEVDAAWDRLAAEGFEVVMIDGSDLRKISKDSPSAVRAPEEWGYGPDAYPVQVDAFHQIHCLNELRKEMHYGYYYGDYANRLDRPLHAPHKKHCLHILLQNLMCQASADVITHDWVEDMERPFADFGITHQCRNFDALLDWVQKNALRDTRVKFNSMDIPHDAVRKSTASPLEKFNGTA